MLRPSTDPTGIRFSQTSIETSRVFPSQLDIEKGDEAFFRPAVEDTCAEMLYSSHMPAASTAAARNTAAEQERKKRLSFTTDQWVPYPVPRVFAFFSDPRNLPRLMPAWQDARIDSLELASRVLPVAERGSRILLSFRPLPFCPIRLRWLALIDDFSANHHFCDLQVTGPFGYWRHCHLVGEESHGDVLGTRITDVVDYAWPAGALSPMFDSLGGRMQIRSIFRYRQRQVLRLLEDDRT